MNLQLAQIKARLSTLSPICGPSIVITIDGPAGSGKTTLAKLLASELKSVHTIHMDDLYEGWQSTLTPILTLKLQDLLETLQSTLKVIYEPYDWLAESKQSAISAPAAEFLIIEGVGSGQSSIRKFVSLALWIEVPAEEGLARVLERDGPAVAQYLPAFLVEQETHFKKEESRNSADYHLSGLGTV
ncbi:MAG: hypothetical protein F2586_02920 [Actinobacteria bacterium]|uniref:Unannotated protein n=1 Tax=freshwater metagenome TaxID=449393 RepID=A0A6J6GZ84_9ZZZZ|nr:hypothetical protein [Actinomycetota bacterium]